MTHEAKGRAMMNSPAARANAVRKTNPQRMRELLAGEAKCDCGEDALVRVPAEDGTGRYFSLCASCHHGGDWRSIFQRERDLAAMLEAIDEEMEED